MDRTRAHGASTGGPRPMPSPRQPDPNASAPPSTSGASRGPLSATLRRPATTSAPAPAPTRSLGAGQANRTPGASGPPAPSAGRSEGRQQQPPPPSRHTPVLLPAELWGAEWCENPSELPPYADAFAACPAARLQHLPRSMVKDWQAATKAVAMDALAALSAKDEHRFAAGVRLFLRARSVIRVRPVRFVPSSPKWPSGPWKVASSAAAPSLPAAWWPSSSLMEASGRWLWVKPSTGFLAECS